MRYERRTQCGELSAPRIVNHCFTLYALLVHQNHADLSCMRKTKGVYEAAKIYKESIEPCSMKNMS